MGDVAERSLEEPYKTCTAPPFFVDPISSLGTPIARSSLPSPLKSAFTSMALTSENKKEIDNYDITVNKKTLTKILVFSNLSLDDVCC